MDDTERNLNEQQLVRRQKLTELRDLGIEPYPLHLPRERTHTAAEAIAAYTRGELAEGQTVTLVGRMMTVRVMGKAAFAHIEDGSGRVQIYLKRDVLGEATYDGAVPQAGGPGRLHHRHRRHVHDAQRRGLLRGA